ncbi:MAG: hypothetical protein LIP03_04750 [Bacteroidales bacterium]|nr:hypothetical protein [Bacteroidales bacterium]
MLGEHFAKPGLISEGWLSAYSELFHAWIAEDYDLAPEPTRAQADTLCAKAAFLIDTASVLLKN